MFENDRVRIWELTLPPGADSNIHRHDLDYILVILGGDRVGRGAGGRQRQSTLPPYFEADGRARSGGVRRAGRHRDRARNVGTEPYPEIIIELKD